MSLPIGIAILIPQLNIFTNTVFLGNYTPSNLMFDKQEYLGAMGIAGIFYLMLCMVGYGLNAGVLMLMSRYAGKNDTQMIGKLFSNSFLLSLLMSAVLIWVSWYLAPIFFKHAIKNEKIVEACVGFIYYRLWGLPFVLIYQLCNSFFIAMNQSKKIIWGSAIQTFFNIVLDALLIFGLYGFAEMGLNGSALASVISEAMFMITNMFLLYKYGYVSACSITFFKKFDKKIVGEIFLKSSPLIMQYFLSIAAWEIFFIMVEHLGKVQSASSQLLRTVFGLIGIAAWALGSTANTMVSNLIGQQKYGEVMMLIKRIVALSVGIAFVLGFPILLFPKQFLSMLTSDIEIVQMGADALQIVVVAIWILSVSTVLFHAVLGVGNTRMNLYMEFIAIILYLSYTYYFIEIKKNELAIAWMAEWMYWGSMLLMSMWYFKTGRWKKHVL